MAQRPWRVVIVCGYGCNLDSPLTPYLNRVARFCQEKTPDAVILCGGATQQTSFPGWTEASVMACYLKSKIGIPFSTWQPHWFLADDSFSVYENIRDAATAIREHWRSDGIEITIFCEATRALKVGLAARWFLGFPPKHGLSPIRLETDSWELMHPTWELISTIEMELTLRFPLINWFRRRQRIRKSKTR